MTEKGVGEDEVRDIEMSHTGVFSDHRYFLFSHFRTGIS